MTLHANKTQEKLPSS